MNVCKEAQLSTRQHSGVNRNYSVDTRRYASLQSCFSMGAPLN